MQTISVEIINPKAIRLLEDMEDLDLIRFSDRKMKQEELMSLLDKFKMDSPPSLEEIQLEVKAVRKAMKKGK